MFEIYFKFKNTVDESVDNLVGNHATHTSTFNSNRYFASYFFFF